MNIQDALLFYSGCAAAANRGAQHQNLTPHSLESAGMQLFRGCQDERAALLKSKPSLYRLCKQRDQLHLDEEHGKWQMVRNINGIVVPDSAYERLRILRFEQHHLGKLHPNGR